MPDFMLTLFGSDILFSVGKVGLLALITLYTIFVFIVLSQVRSLNKIIYIKSSAATFIIQTVLIMYILSVISLFFFALAIL